MIVQKFIAWSDTASPQTRAAAATALAQAYLVDTIDLDRRSAETALTVLLDDPSILVRRAIAEVFSDQEGAPRHVVLALAIDHCDVSCPVLRRSPLLLDEELIDCAAVGGAGAQAAIAARARVSATVSEALAETGAREALIALALNEGADLRPSALRRIFERFGDYGETREALLARTDLPADLRVDIATGAAAALADFVASCDWMSSERAARTARECVERATVAIAAEGSDPGALAAHLRATGRLTLALILRSLLSGERGLLQSTLCELSGLPPERVAGLVRNWRSPGFAALYEKANLPQPLFTAVRAALSAQDERGEGGWTQESGARLQAPIVEYVLRACEARQGAGLAPVLALLRRLACEAAREEAREASRSWRPAQKALAKPPVQIDMAALEAELMAA